MDSCKLLRNIEIWGEECEKPPNIAINLDSNSDHQDAIKYFNNVAWNDVSNQFLAKYWDFPYFFTKEAFHYFLPGIIKLNIEEKSINLFYDSLLSPLDTFDITLLPENTYKQWSYLNKSKLILVKKWLYMLVDFEYFQEDTLLRMMLSIDEFICLKND